MSGESLIALVVDVVGRGLEASEIESRCDEE
jgi:hypothetical protein